MQSPLIEFHRVTVMRGENRALNDVTLSIGAGEHVAILGPNGCGKSTLIKTVTRECYPLWTEHPSVTLLGQQFWNVFELRSLLGIVSNDLMAAATRDCKALELVLSGFFSGIGIWPHQHVTAEMEEKATQALQRMEAQHLADRWTDELSSGEARRVLIARALVHNPMALVLDEPSTALDLFAQHELRTVFSKLAREGVGIIMVTHHLSDLIPEIGRVILMSNGRIAADGPKREVLTEQNLSKLFGLSLELIERQGYYNLW